MTLLQNLALCWSLLQAAKHEAYKEKAKKIMKAQQIQLKRLKEEKGELESEMTSQKGAEGGSAAPQTEAERELEKVGVFGACK